MKLSIGWKSKLEVFDAVGTIETYSDNRNDVIELLKYIDENGINREGLLELFGGKEISSIVIDRVLEYLRECGYINSDALSIKGKNIIESGRVPVEERGKFRFWNIEDLGPMKEMYGKGSKLIIGFRRQGDTNIKYIHRESAYAYKRLKVTMPNSNSEFKVLSLSEYNAGFACIKHQNQSRDINLKLELTSANKIDLKVNGNLYDFGHNGMTLQNNTIFSDVNTDNPISEYIISILNQYEVFNDYDIKRKSFKINKINTLIENNIINENDLESFKAKINIKNIAIGDSIYDIEAEDIPIMPSNELDANIWFTRIIESRIADGYINDEEFNSLLNEIASRPEFENYINVKQLSKVMYIDKLKRSNKLRAYWNLQAPSELKPNSSNNEMILDRIDISIGTEMSMKQLIQNLVGNNKVDKLIFSSKYIIRNDQKRKFEIFVEELKSKGCNEVNLITQYKFDLKDIKVKTYDEIYGSRKNWPHDRYFSLLIDGVWHYYKMSAELDQCKYDEEDLDKWSATQIGKWKDISFDKIDRNIFPLELLKIEDYI